jgi:hypothetical protein
MMLFFYTENIAEGGGSRHHNLQYFTLHYSFSMFLHHCGVNLQLFPTQIV